MFSLDVHHKMFYLNRQHRFAYPFSEDFEQFVNLVSKRFVLEYIAEFVNNPRNEEQLFKDLWQLQFYTSVG